MHMDVLGSQLQLAIQFAMRATKQTTQHGFMSHNLLSFIFHSFPFSITFFLYSFGFCETYTDR